MEFEPDIPTRLHRKRLKIAARWEHLTGFRPRPELIYNGLNAWIGVFFSIGATLFGAACIGALWPTIFGDTANLEQVVNRTFFIGSIPFSCAAFLQLLQAQLSGPPAPTTGTSELAQQGPRWPWSDLGWRACLFQFVGTLLFNINTFDAMYAPPDWLLEDLEIWVPNMLGSILFLASGILAAREIWEEHGYWKPASVEWLIGGINLLGCCAFMVAALFAIYTPQPLPFDAAAYALGFTLLGAVCFLVGALLLVLEAEIDTRIGRLKA